MTTGYDEAVETLYRGPLDTFVVDRKRLAGELKAGGDKAGAARLAKLGRPSISAWTVNQLFWHEREAFERLLAAARRVKTGEHDAGAAHRQALSALRALGAARLVSGGHAAAEPTLRRVTMTLSALAATGSFEPDPAGALVADRDPPGFEAFGVAAERKPQPEAKSREQAAAERKRAEVERQRLEEERARKHAERQRLKAALSAAQTDAATHQRETERLRHELGGAEAKLEKARSTVTKLKDALAALD